MATFLTDLAPVFLNDALGTASGSITVPGYTELNSATATAFVLSAAPYVGAVVGITKTGSATASGGVKTVVTNATGVTLNTTGDRTMTFDGEGDSVILVGVSTTRWQVIVNAGPVALS